jgi:nucleoside 2-deoxyribosyltransferase
MIYLASPYWHADPTIRNQRFRAACRAVAQMIRQGVTVFSPVVYGHALVGEGLPGDWSFWQRHDGEYLTRCDEVVVLQIDGWEESEGVREELRLAAAIGKSVRYLAPARCELAAGTLRRRG